MILNWPLSFPQRFNRPTIPPKSFKMGGLAIQHLAVTLPDVVILDLHLPFVSGADVLQQIRADPRLARTQVIIITADLFRAEALRDQTDAILLKPIGFIRLQNLVAKLQALQIAKLIE